MEYTLKKGVIKVKLELTTEEFMTIVCGMGGSSDNRRREIANEYYNFKLPDSQHKVYTDLKEIALSLKEY